MIGEPNISPIINHYCSSVTYECNSDSDTNKVLEGHCIYLPYFFCTATDSALLHALKADLEAESLARRTEEKNNINDRVEELQEGREDIDHNDKEKGGGSKRSEVEGMINWSKHLKHENPDFSQTFKKIITDMAEYFDVEVLVITFELLSRWY